MSASRSCPVSTVELYCHCYAPKGVAHTQRRAVFITIQSLLHSIVFLALPVIFERTGKLRGLVRAIKQVRVGFIVEGTQTTLTLLLAFVSSLCRCRLWVAVVCAETEIIRRLVNSISANVKGCKDPSTDPHASKKGYTDKLPGFCRNKRALTAFLWFSFGD
jgi:hypothetical protein